MVDQSWLASLSISDRISLVGVFVGVATGGLTYFLWRRTESIAAKARAAQEEAERRRLIESIILETHVLSGDVRLLIGQADQMLQRINTAEVKSGSVQHSGFAYLRNQCEGKKIDAQDRLDALAPLARSGDEVLPKMEVADLEKLLRSVRISVDRVRVLQGELDSMKPEGFGR